MDAKAALTCLLKWACKTHAIKKAGPKTCIISYKVVRQKGFEPLPFRFVAERSIQLSYWRINLT
jgi:hypothetical protein